MTDLTYVRTGSPEFDELFPRVRKFLEQDTMDMRIDGQTIRGYRSPDTPSVWIRDHSDMMRGFRYFEKDLVSAVDHFAETQGRNGRIFDYFTVQPEKLPCERENWTKYVRVPVEADVEYRFVKAAFLAWQTTGDDDWIASLLPHLEKALAYAFSHPWRWDPEHQLVKRAYTIDSWDFAYTAGRHDWLQFQIDDDTFWGILHGDNSGYHEACLHLSIIYRHLRKTERASYWSDFAEGLRKRMNAACWNGRYYTHFVKLSPVTIPGVDEATQLSFSNAMNINRGVTSHAQAVSILREYQKRKHATNAFAEWFSIEPPFPDGIFGDEKIVGGAYCNGGIMPLVGGELARAYLEHGFEEQGVGTLRQYFRMIAEKNETYLWYTPEGTPSSVDTSTSPDAMPTDGWGSSAMLYGFLEGLVGVQDHARLFEQTTLAPRWHAAGITEAEARVGYEVSGASIAYAYREHASGIELSIEAERSAIRLHLLIPSDATVESVSDSTGNRPFTESRIESSRYVDLTLDVKGGSNLSVAFK